MIVINNGHPSSSLVLDRSNPLSYFLYSSIHINCQAKGKRKETMLLVQLSDLHIRSNDKVIIDPRIVFGGKRIPLADITRK
jgi:hypothetical protein